MHCTDHHKPRAARIAMCSTQTVMKKADNQPPVYVVYTAALFDGWEVVKEPASDAEFFEMREDAISYAKARAATEGGGVVKLENWFGDTEAIWEVPPGAPARTGSATGSTGNGTNSPMSEAPSGRRSPGARR